MPETTKQPAAPPFAASALWGAVVEVDLPLMNERGRALVIRDEDGPSVQCHWPDGFMRWVDRHFITVKIAPNIIISRTTVHDIVHG